MENISLVAYNLVTVFPGEYSILPEVPLRIIEEQNH